MAKLNYFGVPADDPDRARNFYTNVFEWRFEVAWEYDTPTGREKMWDIFTDANADTPAGGLTRREYPGQGIMAGIEVGAIDDALSRIASSGGDVVVSKQQIPGRAWFAVCRDPEGNSFVVYERLP